MYRYNTCIKNKDSVTVKEHIGPKNNYNEMNLGHSGYQLLILILTIKAAVTIFFPGVVLRNKYNLSTKYPHVIIVKYILEHIIECTS